MFCVFYYFYLCTSSFFSSIAWRWKLYGAPKGPDKPTLNTLHNTHLTQTHSTATVSAVLFTTSLIHTQLDHNTRTPRSLHSPSNMAEAQILPDPPSPDPPDPSQVQSGLTSDPLSQAQTPALRGARDPPSMEPPYGDSFVLLSRSDQRTLKGISPFGIKRALDKFGTFISARVISSGSLLLHAPTRDAAFAALTIRAIGGHPVTAVVADRLNSTLTSVRSTDLLGLSDQELLDELRSQGVMEVERLPSRDPSRPNPRIKLRFRGRNVPAVITAGYLYIEVNLWYTKPQRCRKCDRFGHSDRNKRPCRSPPKCGRCQAGHRPEECPEGIVASCQYCGLMHEPDNHNECPEWHRQKQILDQRTRAAVTVYDPRVVVPEFRVDPRLNRAQRWQQPPPPGPQSVPWNPAAPTDSGREPSQQSYWDRRQPLPPPAPLRNAEPGAFQPAELAAAASPALAGQTDPDSGHVTAATHSADSWPILPSAQAQSGAISRQPLPPTAAPSISDESRTVPPAQSPPTPQSEAELAESAEPAVDESQSEAELTESAEPAVDESQSEAELAESAELPVDESQIVSSGAKPSKTSRLPKPIKPIPTPTFHLRSRGHATYGRKPQ